MDTIQDLKTDLKNALTDFHSVGGLKKILYEILEYDPLNIDLYYKYEFNDKYGFYSMMRVFARYENLLVIIIKTNDAWIENERYAILYTSWIIQNDFPEHILICSSSSGRYLLLRTLETRGKFAKIIEFETGDKVSYTFLDTLTDLRTFDIHTFSPLSYLQYKTNVISAFQQAHEVLFEYEDIFENLLETFVDRNILAYNYPITREREREIALYYQNLLHSEKIRFEIEYEFSQNDNGMDSIILRNMLVLANVRFVRWVLNDMNLPKRIWDDCFQEGILGLIEAANRFDPTRGFKFISYAVHWIRQRIFQWLNSDNVVNIPLNRLSDLKRIEDTIINLEQELNREPSIFEISKRLNMNPYEVSYTLKISNKHLSLEELLNHSEDDVQLDVIQNNQQPSPDSNLMQESLRREVERALSTLTRRQAEVVKLYFGLDQEHPLTYEKIGFQFGLTRERIRQIFEKALKRLRHISRSRALRQYLG